MGKPHLFLLKKLDFEIKLFFIFIIMSREEFRNFVKTVEHNIQVKDKLLKCKTSEDLILIAKKHGYCITLEDLNYDKTATKFESWFKESRINPLKYIK